MVEHSKRSDALQAARRVADYAVSSGVLKFRVSCRPVCCHMGAVLADSVLQAGVSYATIVRPRLQSILKVYPHASTTSLLKHVIVRDGSSAFLQWTHHEKVSRFEDLVVFMAEAQIENTFELSVALRSKAFRSALRKLRGIGPKTVDYMACLVGVDCVAIDRHIRSFAESAGLVDDDYDYLRDVFSFAADLLSISRRDFDARIWRHQSKQSDYQLSLELVT